MEQQVAGERDGGPEMIRICLKGRLPLAVKRCSDGPNNNHGSGLY
jgi:hypothetical protein